MRRLTVELLALALAGVALGPGSASAGPHKAKPVDVSAPATPPWPAAYNMAFADRLAALAAKQPLTLQDLRRLAQGSEQQTDTLDGHTYSWIIDKPSCSSSLVAQFGAYGGATVTISTPNDVSVQMNDHGAMQCTPIDCASARLDEARIPTDDATCD